MNEYVMKYNLITLSTKPVPIYRCNDYSLVGHLHRFHKSLFQKLVNYLFGHGDSYINLICKDVDGQIRAKILDTSSFFRRRSWKVIFFNNNEEYIFDLFDTATISIFGRFSFNFLNQDFTIEDNELRFRPKLKDSQNVVLAECSRSLNPTKPEINLTIFDPAFNIFNIHQISSLFFTFFLRFG